MSNRDRRDSDLAPNADRRDRALETGAKRIDWHKAIDFNNFPGVT